MCTRNQLSEILGEIAAESKTLFGSNLGSVILFGSYARGEATEESDIDIMVLGGKNFDPTDVFCIADELYDLSGKDVDVYEEREINKSSEFYKNILKDGIRL